MAPEAIVGLCLRFGNVKCYNLLDPLGGEKHGMTKM